MFQILYLGCWLADSISTAPQLCFSFFRIVRSVFVSTVLADGKYCLTAGHDRTIILWNPCRPDPAFRFPDASMYATASSFVDDIPVASLPRALPIQRYEEGIRRTPADLVVNDASTRLFIGTDKAAVLLDSITAQVLRQWHGHTAVINSVAMMAGSGDVLASASYDTTVCLWDGRSHSTRPIQTLKEAKDSVTVVHIDSDDAVIRTASVDGTVRTYDIRKGILQCDNFHSPITSMACFQDGRDEEQYWAISCLDGAIRIVNDRIQGTSSSNSRTESKLLVPTLCRNGHVAGRYALECCFLAAGFNVLSGSENGTAVLYDISRTKLRTTRPPQTPTMAPVQRELLGHSGPVCSVAAHPKLNHVVVSASYDGNCVVWANHRDYMQEER
jgi:mitogen-activated protein kinase organizer 1